MSKKCIICEETDANFFIKGTNEGYCKECAEDQFSDLSLLITAEEQAKTLKEQILKQEDEELSALKEASA